MQAKPGRESPAPCAQEEESPVAGPKAGERDCALEHHLRAASPFAKRLGIVNKALTALGYVAYPTLLILLFFFDRVLLVRCISVPAIAFVVVTVIRSVYNAPRPYETPGVEPLFPKSTLGKSFPSRHTFCMFMIAFSWMTWVPWGLIVGGILTVLACVMARIRVLARVHFARDVIAGALFAALFAVVGYLVLP